MEKLKPVIGKSSISSLKFQKKSDFDKINRTYHIRPRLALSSLEKVREFYKKLDWKKHFS